MTNLQILPALNVGGVERGTVDLARALVARGHRAIVVSSGGALVADLEAAGAVHVTLPVHLKRPWTVARMVPRVVRLIEEHGVDLVHARSRVPGWIAYGACRRTGTTFITTCHGQYGRHWRSRVMGWGKRVIVNSEMIGRYMREAFGVPAERMRVIPRGVDLEQFRFQPPRREGSPDWVVGMVGRMTRLKGHEVLLKAMAKVNRQFPHVQLWVVGDAPRGKGGYRQELELLAKRLGLADQVKFLGDRSDVPDLMERMDLLVMPSIEPEGFGRVLIEAGAVGVPVVASQVGGIVEVVADGDTGRLVPPEDINALAETMVELLRDRQEATRLAEAARQRVENRFSLQQMVEHTLVVYEEAVRERKVLIVKLGAVGDVVLATPSIRAIRERYREAHVALLVGRASADLVRSSPFLDDVLVDDYLVARRGWLGAMRTASMLSREGFEISIDMQNNRRTHLMTYVAGIPQRYGYHNGKWSALLNHRVPGFERRLPPVDHQFQLLRYMGIQGIDQQLEVWISPEDDARGEVLLRETWSGPETRLVAMHPGGSPRWSTKRWPVEYYAKLCTELSRKGVRTVITGTAGDEALADELCKQTRGRPLNLVGRTRLSELAAVLRHCDVLICGDTAPLHIAAAVDTPVVAIFGPTDPVRHMPPSALATEIHRDVECSPCYSATCPIDLRCMHRVRVADVLKALEPHLQPSATADTPRSS